MPSTALPSDMSLTSAPRPMAFPSVDTAMADAPARPASNLRAQASHALVDAAAGEVREVEPRFVPARDALLRVGLRITQPRLRVLSLFLERPSGPLSADQVMRLLVERGDKASLSSVYAALRQLDGAKLLASRFDDGCRVYEEAGSLPRARVVCPACGVEHVFRDAGLDALLRRIVREHGFDLVDYKVLVEGICSQSCGCGPK